MNMKSFLFGLPLLALCMLFAVPRLHAESAQDRVVRMAELEIVPNQLQGYRAALQEEIEASIRLEPGVLDLYAVSVRNHPEQIRLFEIYRNAAAYQAHLDSPHFKRYKERTRNMVKSLKLVETDPILLGSKSR